MAKCFNCRKGVPFYKFLIYTGKKGLRCKNCDIQLFIHRKATVLVVASITIIPLTVLIPIILFSPFYNKLIFLLIIYLLTAFISTKLSWRNVRFKPTQQRVKIFKQIVIMLPLLFAIMIFINGLQYAFCKRNIQALYSKNPSIAIIPEKSKFYSDELLSKEYQLEKHSFNDFAVYIPEDYDILKKGKNSLVFVKCDQVIYFRRWESFFPENLNIFQKMENKGMLRGYHLAGNYGFYKDVHYASTTKYNRSNYFFMILKEMFISEAVERLGKLERIYDFQINGKEGLLKVYRMTDSTTNFSYMLKVGEEMLSVDFFSKTPESSFDMNFTNFIVSKTRTGPQKGFE